MAKFKKIIVAGPLVVECVYPAPNPRDSVGVRAGKREMSSEAQRRMNLKYAYQKLELLIAANFGIRDLYVTLTYDDAHLPPDKRAAGKCLQCFFRKWRTARRRRGQELRYIYVTEGWHGKRADEYFGGDGRLEDRRLHHHVVINGCGPGDLDEIRSLWQYGGYVRVEPVDVHYYRELAKYLTKEAREFGRSKPGERTWRPSRNLTKYEVEYIEIPSDSVTLSAPPGAVDYVQFSERNPYGFADCVGARYLLFESEATPDYSYTRGRKKNRP